MAAVSYSNCDSAIFDGGTGADVFNSVNSTLASMPVAINSGDGADTIDVIDNAAGSFVTVDGQVGLDTVNVNNDSAGTAAVHFINTQDLAALNVRAGGTATVVELVAPASSTPTTPSPSPAPARLDLIDNDLILD